MKIRSVTDVITNSSSETFIISYQTDDPKELQNLLQEYRVDCGEGGVNSGMGGILKVSSLNSWSEKVRCRRETNREQCYTGRIPWIPESLVIEIDHSLIETIKFFREYYPEAYNID